MQLLLKRGNDGDVLQGSDRQLLERAAQGDDLTLYIESVGYDEFIIFGNYVVSEDRVAALSLPHLDHGDLPKPTVLDREPIATAQYIYDSRTDNVLTKDFLDSGVTQTTVYANNPTYAGYTWYSTRRYVEFDLPDLASLVACGDQFKVRLDLAGSFKVVLKPDIVYFPYKNKDYLVKSSVMLLPTELVADPWGYIAKGQPLTANENYSICYINVGSDNVLTIIGKQRFSADQKVNQHIREGKVSRQNEGRTLVTRVECEHVVLVPEERDTEPGRKELDL